MELGTNGWLMVWGGGLVLLAIIIWWRTSRYDIKGAAVDSVWQIARGRRTADNPTAIDVMARDIGAAPTVTGKAKRSVFTVIGHFIAQLLSIAALIMLVVGVILLAVGWFWG